MAKPIVTGLNIEGAREVSAALRELGPDAEQALAEANKRIAKTLASRIKTKGKGQGRQAALVAGSVRAITSRGAAAVQVGGSSPRGSGGGSALDLLIGSEFGISGQGGAGEGSRNFKPHGFLSRVRTGMWIYPTVAANNVMLYDEWHAATDQIIRDFGSDF